MAQKQEIKLLCKYKNSGVLEKVRYEAPGGTYSRLRVVNRFQIVDWWLKDTDPVCVKCGVRMTAEEYRVHFCVEGVIEELKLPNPMSLWRGEWHLTSGLSYQSYEGYEQEYAELRFSDANVS